jgi:hypothetical protein
MSDESPLQTKSMGELVELSSLGSPAVLEERRRTPPAVKHQLLATLIHQPADQDGDLSGAPATAAPYFFLSYARAATPGQDVRGFFRLLCEYLSQLAADIATDESATTQSAVPGYLAGDAPDGGQRYRLLGALASCRVFVPLLSAGYFDDPACRREWESFRRRDDIRRRRHPFGFSAIVPVLWDGSDVLDVPDWAADAPLADPTLGPAYVERGVHGLWVENADAYRQVAFRIARRIHDVAECLPAPTAEPDEVV